MSGMQYLEGFSWPVPVAFAGAVSACRFEQGDVLYDAKAGYRPWASALAGVRHAIQVLDPPRGNRALASDQESSRFLANWSSDVTFSISEIATGTAQQQTTSQGRLFTFLWHGDFADLATDSPPPEPPRLQRDLHRVVEQALPAFRRHFAKDAAGRVAGPATGSIYVSAVDLSSDAARAKASGIEAVLAEGLRVTRRDLAPKRAGVEGAEGYHPALVVRGLHVAGASVGEVEAILKRHLYAPGNNGDGRKDRFSLARHGHLAPATEPDATD